MAGPSPLWDASLAAREALVGLGRRYFGLGWLFSTAGNLSARVGDAVVITASGKHKGDLVPDDFVVVALDGTLLATGAPGGRASAETAIHLAIYRTHPRAAYCLHVHSIAATLVTEASRGVDLRVSPDPVEARAPAPFAGVPALRFAGLEMLKAWDLWDEDTTAELPLFPNHADVARIAAEVETYYQAQALAAPRWEVPALLIRGHGLTAWGSDAASANRHVEATEFLCQLARAL